MEDTQYLHCLGSFEGYFEPLMTKIFSKGKFMRKKQGFFGLQEILCFGYKRGAGMGCERKLIYENEPQSVAYTMIPLKRYFKGQILYTIKFSCSKKIFRSHFLVKYKWCGVRKQVSFDPKQQRYRVFVAQFGFFGYDLPVKTLFILQQPF